jgi:hypothetical protein
MSAIVGGIMVVSIGEIVRNGVVFDMKNWDDELDSSGNLLELVEGLFDILTSRNINYLLVGGIALLSYVSGRNTQDIDLILAIENLQFLPEISIIDENKDFARGLYSGLQVDFLLTRNPLFQLIISNYATSREFGGRNIRCVTVEGLVILKLFALPSLYRQGNFTRVSIYENDVTLLLINYDIDLSPILSVLRSYLTPTDLQEVNSIIDDIKVRINRFQQQRNKLQNDAENE